MVSMDQVSKEPAGIHPYLPHDPGHNHHCGFIKGIEEANEFLSLLSEYTQRHTEHHSKQHQTKDVHAISFSPDRHLKQLEIPHCKNHFI